MEINCMDNRIQFESIVKDKIKREGITQLMSYLADKTDFFVAPASSRFHLSVKGGLVQHSLNVYECLMAKRDSKIWKPILEKYSDETLALISLFHDLCKANMYVEAYKNKKCYDKVKVAMQPKYNIKHDAAGDYFWETVPGYEIDEKFPFGHGEKSVLILNRYVELSGSEMMAVRWHMGYSEPFQNWNSLRSAQEKYPLAIALHEADMEASSILELEGNFE